MTVGFLTDFVTQFQGVMLTGITALKPIVVTWLSFLVVVELVRTLGAGALSSSGQGPHLVRFGVRTLVWVYAIMDFPHLADVLYKTCAGLGLRAGGNALTIAQFLDPSAYLDHGLKAGQILEDAFNANISLDGFVAAFFFLVVWVVFLLSFAYLGLRIMILQIEFSVAIVCALLILPAAVVRGMGWLAAGALSYPINCGFRFFVMALLASVVTPLTTTIVGVGATWETGITMLIAALCLAYLFAKADSLASGILSGSPALGVGGLLQTVALGAVALSGGSAALAAGSRTLLRGGAMTANRLSGGRLQVPLVHAPKVPTRRVLYNTLVTSARHLQDQGGPGPTAPLT